jgi:hypothetical protein
MSGDLTHQSAGRDRTSINLKEKPDVLYWTEVLGVSEGTLRNAVQQVGHSTLAVREFLNSRAGSQLNS